MKKCFTVVAAFAMTFLAAQSQAAANFSGEWKLNLAKSDYGPIQQFAPEFMVRTVKHDDPAIPDLDPSKGRSRRSDHRGEVHHRRQAGGK